MENGENNRGDDEPWDGHRGDDSEPFEPPNAAVSGVIGLMKREPAFVRHAHAVLGKYCSIPNWCHLRPNTAAFLNCPNRNASRSRSGRSSLRRANRITCPTTASARVRETARRGFRATGLTNDAEIWHQSGMVDLRERQVASSLIETGAWPLGRLARQICRP